MDVTAATSNTDPPEVRDLKKEVARLKKLVAALKNLVIAKDDVIEALQKESAD